MHACMRACVHACMRACMQMVCFLSFLRQLRAMVKKVWELFCGSSDKNQEIQDIRFSMQVQVLPEFTKVVDPKFQNTNKDCLEVRGKVYRH